MRGISQQGLGSSTMLAADGDSRRIGAIISQLIVGIMARLVNWFAFKSRLNRI